MSWELWNGVRWLYEIALGILAWISLLKRRRQWLGALCLLRHGGLGGPRPESLDSLGGAWVFCACWLDCCQEQLDWLTIRIWEN
jgi:hypothetical protein